MTWLVVFGGLLSFALVALILFARSCRQRDALGTYRDVAKAGGDVKPLADVIRATAEEPDHRWLSSLWRRR